MENSAEQNEVRQGAFGPGAGQHAATPHTVPQTELTTKFVERAKPGELRHSIQQLNLRSKIHGRSFNNEAYVYGQHGYDPSQILAAGRRQLHERIKGFSEGARYRVWYFYQAQLSPQPVRNQIAAKGLYAMTFLPGFNRFKFPESATYMPMEAIQVMTMNMRRGRHNDVGLRTDHFDVRLHALSLDTQSGTIKIGGGELIDGQPYSRTVLSRDFSREPGRSPLAVPRGRLDVIDSALACHEMLETYAVSDMPYQRVPLFPKIYLGFKHDGIPRYETARLRRSATSFIAKCLRKGLEMEPSPEGVMKWFESVVPKLVSVDPDGLEDWETLKGLLGDDDVEDLLNLTLEKNIVHFRGLHLVPLTFFPPELIKDLMDDVGGVFVRISDLLGREQLTLKGDVTTDRGFAKIQVMKLMNPVGRLGVHQYDFDATELGVENELA